MIELMRLGRLKRRTQHQRLGEMPNKAKIWRRLFLEDERQAKIFNKVRQKIEKRTIFQVKAQEIGKIREEKIFEVLQSLKDKRKIVSFLSMAKFSSHDLMDGIDFSIIYINKIYKILDFSVTGKRWAEEHQKRHSEVPVLIVFLKESKRSLEKKILGLLDRSRKVC